MRAKPGLDMRNRHCGGEGRKRGAERRGRVALDDQEVGATLEQRPKSQSHRADMRVRVFLSCAAKIDPLKAIEIEFGWIQTRMLTGENEGRQQPISRERARDGQQLDGFRPGANDQPYVRKMQATPLARRR